MDQHAMHLKWDVTPRRRLFASSCSMFKTAGPASAGWWRSLTTQRTESGCRATRNVAVPSSPATARSLSNQRSTPGDVKNDRSGLPDNCGAATMHRRGNEEDTTRTKSADVGSSRSTRNCHLDRVYPLSAALKTEYLKSSRWRTPSFLLFACLLFTMLCTASGNGCMIGLETAGRTWPAGDIVVQTGKSLKIYCILNQTYVDIHMPDKNSSDLTFFRGRRLISSEFVSQINETTILLDLPNPPPSEDMYYCQIRLDNGGDRKYEAVCLNNVVVGTEPSKPKNFSCISRNWENLTCTWEPRHNYIHTTFSLMFRLPGQMRSRKLLHCPKEYPRLKEELPPNTCMWDATTSPIYRQPYEIYAFVMHVHNILGNATFHYRINHYAVVIPARPENLTVINKTLDSVLLYWNVPFPLQNFPPGLHHRIMYANQWDNQKTWKVINIITEVHTSRKFYNLSGLEYSNTMYDVRVLMKSVVATDNMMWSEFSHVTFRTLPRVPGLPPRTDIGSFEIDENNGNRDVYLYWQAIPENQENGDDFKYQIVLVEESGHVIDEKTYKPSEMTKTYAKFRGISFNSYRFEIVSTNEVGPNPERARIFVPSKYEMPHEPFAFTKIAFEGGLYELSWKPPMVNKDITNYTIYWCNNERDRPYQCTGYLNWVQVSNDTTIYNMTVPEPNEVYQFAISANTERGSSGMIWASCTVIHDKMVGKMKSVWINRIGSDFIEVGWKLDCSDRIGIIDGFNIYYCPIVSPYNLNCKGPKLKKTISVDSHMIHGIVDDLMPYTTYMLAVAVLTKSGEGLHSDPLYNTTLEAAPSTSPLDVKITNVTNTTMSVTWKPPTAMNGVLRYYEIYYNNHARNTEEDSHVELTDLIPYHRYNISVAACTVMCSKKSPVKTQDTDVGVPSKLNVPIVRFVNSSQVYITLEVPEHAAGPLENMYYEIETSNGEIQNTTQLKVYLPISDCMVLGRDLQYNFRVRAVNVIANDVRLKGPWSDPGEGNCYSNGSSYIMLVVKWVLGSIGVVGFILGATYFSKRLWLRCQAMRDVEVKLPPGLAPNMKLLQKVNEPHIRQPSADSSGCSSGQESVTSSLTAESQVCSDSGTEIGQVPVSPAKLLEDTLPSWENSKPLRQRNITQGSDTAKSADSHRWDPYVKVAKSGESMVVGETASLARSTPNLTESTGCTTSPHTWSSTGYISMPSSEELSSTSNPAPRENASVAQYTRTVGGRYCVIGKKPDDDNGIGALSDSNDEANDALIPPVQQETKPVTNPYVTVASLEEKQKEKQQQPAKISFRELNKQLDPLVDTDDKLQLDTYFTVPDKTKTTTPRPLELKYVQAGLINTVLNPLNPCGSNLVEQLTKASGGTFISLTDTFNKPYTSLAALTPTASSSLLDKATTVLNAPPTESPCITELSQPSTTTSYTAETEKSSPPAEKGDLATQDAPIVSSDGSSNYVFASPVHRILQKQYHQHKRHNRKHQQEQQEQQQQQQQQREPSSADATAEDTTREKKKNADEEDKKSVLCPSSWRSSSSEPGREVTAAQRINPARMPIITRQKSGYVTIAENPDAASTASGQSDEQYSKMTVAPSTVQ